MSNTTSQCFAPARILLPAPGTPLDPWACIAVDQFTSQPEYWQKAEALAKDKPSTLHIVLPEAYLGAADEADRLESIRRTMADYRRSLLTRVVNGFVYLERTQMDGTVRQGLVGAVDLEAYSFDRDATPGGGVPVKAVCFQVHRAHQALTDGAVHLGAFQVDKAVDHPGQQAAAVVRHGAADGFQPVCLIRRAQVSLGQNDMQGAGLVLGKGLGFLPVFRLGGELVHRDAGPGIQGRARCGQQDAGRCKALGGGVGHGASLLFRVGVRP